MNNSDADVVIAGAGPAGAITSLFLCKYKIPHVLLDKAAFPRDKICGDALSGKVMDILRELDGHSVDKIIPADDQFLGSYGVKFVAPNGRFVDIPFSVNGSALNHAPGFISRRIHFDHFLFQKIDRSVATIIEHAEVLELTPGMNNRITVAFRKNDEINSIRCKLLVGAEGDRSVISKKLAGNKKEDEHYSAGLRAYYKGVKNFHSQNYIELHFLKELLPGYFWIFPLPNGEANVGVGVPSSVVSRKKINLRQQMLHIIETHPPVRERFSEAEIIGEIKGWGLPLGSRQRKISGNNFLLAGDAASLIDPFTGEGIGNAMTSGMIAAKQVREALLANRFDETFLSAYDKRIYETLWSELKLSKKLQNFAKYEWPFNLVVNNASKNKELRELISGMFEDLNMREKLNDPKFYFRLLFNRH